MAALSLGNSTFLVGHCQSCDREVLTHLDVGPADNEIRRCFHCDRVITSGLRAVPGNELETTGYALQEAGGCGKGGACSTGGCAMRQRS
jgi:hypothetical protein